MSANTTAIAPEKKARQELFNKMDPKLQSVARTFEAVEQQLKKNDLVSRHKLGTKIREVVENDNVYGAGAVEKLAEYLGDYTAAGLYNLRTYADQYTEEQVIAIADRTMANGQHVTYTHLLEISKIKSEGARAKMLERTFKDSLSAGQIAAEVTAKFATRNSRSGGRPPAVPHSIGAAATQVQQTFQSLENRFDPWKASLIDASKQINDDDATPELLEKLKQGREKIDEVEGKMDGFKTGFDSAIKRVETAVNKKKKAAGKDEAEAKSEQARLEGRKSGRRAPAAAK